MQITTVFPHSTTFFIIFFVLSEILPSECLNVPSLSISHKLTLKSLSRNGYLLAIFPVLLLNSSFSGIFQYESFIIILKLF